MPSHCKARMDSEDDLIMTSTEHLLWTDWQTSIEFLLWTDTQTEWFMIDYVAVDGDISRPKMASQWMVGIPGGAEGVLLAGRRSMQRALQALRSRAGRAFKGPLVVVTSESSNIDPRIEQLTRQTFPLPGTVASSMAQQKVSSLLWPVLSCRLIGRT